MKKLFSLVLALAMLLTAAFAIAEGSKEEPTIGGDVSGVPMEFIADTEESAAAIKAFADAKEAGDVLAPLPDDVKAKIPEGFATISEMVTAKLDGEIDNLPDEVVMNVMFETPYSDGQKVIVLIGILPENAEEEIEWQAFDGVGKADGSVDVTVPKAVFEKVQTNPFLIGVISE
ncbi:hypothetical protein JNO48_02460 [Clostridiales bacterium]|nr:hypothetical protein JNO48_02460 [Clostridiales bacterium]